MTTTVTPLVQTVRVELAKGSKCPDLKAFSDLSDDLDDAWTKAMMLFESSVRLVGQIHKVKLQVSDND